jgi:aminopeptidase N
MKLKSLFFSILLLIITGRSLYGGTYGGKKQVSAGKTSLADPGEGDYDITYLKFNLHVTDTSVFVWGDVSTTAQVVATTMTNYFFELDTLMVIDSAKVNGTLYPVTNVGFIRKITLGSALPMGSFFTAQIFYHGVPPAGGGFFNGLTHAISGGGTHMLYTVSDPWVALDWWPAKQSANDKIDSVDMFITVPAGVMDGSNGVLVNVDNTSTPGFSTFHWQTHYPITYYLISIAVAKYSEYKSYMHFTGSPDSMLIQNFFLDTATFNPAYKANFDSVAQIIDYFSTQFGRYPFWQEKYGVCFTNLPGGMENQTMTTIGVTDTRTIAHELMHQWFGDNVTYKRWGEVWLSEGFATFAEQLFYTQFWGPAKGKAHRQTLYNNAMGQACGQVFVTDTSGPTTLFFQPNVYNKGAAVVNMLRYIAPEDSLFFRMLRIFQQTYAMGNASTDDLKAIAQTEYGMNLDTFFNQWIYGKGFPKYTITWDQVGTTVSVRLVQTASCPATTPHFSTPVQLQLHSSTGDTIVKVYNSLDNQVFTFDWAPTMSTVYLNPDIWTLCKLLGTVTQDTTLRHLGTCTVYPGNIRIYPNPSKNNWQMEHISENMTLSLTDINGRIIWKGTSGKSVTTIPGEKLPTGSYFLKIGDNADSIKLVHW